MLYEVGTYIDLRHLNQTAEEQPETPRLTSYEQYDVGTKIVFLNLGGVLSPSL